MSDATDTAAREQIERFLRSPDRGHDHMCSTELWDENDNPIGPCDCGRDAWDALAALVARVEQLEQALAQLLEYDLVAFAVGEHHIRAARAALSAGGSTPPPDPVAGRGSHAPLTDAALGERLYRAESELREAREIMQGVVDADRRDAELGHPNPGDSAVSVAISLSVMPFLAALSAGGTTPPPCKDSSLLAWGAHLLGGAVVPQVEDSRDA